MSFIFLAATFSRRPGEQIILYDGHGSVRHLTNNSGVITESYDYDAYGNLLGAVTPQTSLLYAGEMLDNNLQQYYLRARWYNPANGRFNRMDPFAGNNQDPQSLHKYLYAHSNPINYIDPSGHVISFSSIGQLVVQSIRAALSGIRTVGLVGTIRHASNAIVGGMVGWDIYQGLKNGDATLDAGTVGVAISLGNEKSPIGGAVNPEIAIGAGSKHNFGFYIGGGVTTNNALSFAGYVGVAFNTPTCGSYKGLTRSVTLSLNLLPSRWRSLIKEKVEDFLPRLHEAFMARKGDIGQVARNLNPEIVAKASGVLTKGLSKGMSGSSVTFWGGQGNNAFGITFSPGLVSGGRSRNISVSYQYYWLLWPGKGVSFRE